MSHRRTIALAFSAAMLLPITLPLVPTALAAEVETPASGAGLPTFGVFAGPTNSAFSEPTVGINHETGTIWFMDNSIAWKITMDLEADPVTAVWDDSFSPLNSIENIDPMLWTDLGTGRTFAGGLAGECSIMSYTDDDGESWIPTGNQCAGAFDHQTIGTGPWASPRPPQALDDRATYYCAQGWINWPDNACVTSYDGGIAYGPPINWAGPCFGLHGHVNVSRNGYAYVPTRSCGGSPGYAYSRDNGLSWNSKNFPAFTVASNGFDTTMGSSSNNRLWFGFERNDWVPMVATSDDNGDTWSTPVAVGADLGIKTSTFLRVMSGDPDRAVLVYLGSTTDGNPFLSSWKGVWDLYASFTYDGGLTWSTVKITQDPVQRGWMCAQGLSCSSGRNLLDFMGSTLGPRGEVIVGFADGCVNACAGPFGTSGQSTSAWSTIARQLTGRTLYAAYDTAAVEIVGTLLGGAGTPITLTANVAAELPYSATIHWGDGAIDTLTAQTAPQLVAQHAYANAGTYDVSVVVTGSDGSSGSDSAQATVSQTTGTIQISSPGEGESVGELVTVTGIVSSTGNSAPTAAFSAAVNGRDVQFDAQASSDPDGDALSFSWLFGDGGTGSGVAPAHTYATAGTYQACLTVSDGSLSAELCQPITIANSGATRVVTDAEGDAANPYVPELGQIADMDILSIDATTTQFGELVLTMTVKTLATPDHHATQGGNGAQWQIEWQGPMGLDFMGLDAGLSAYKCGWGYFDTELDIYSGQGSTPCTVTPGTPGLITLTFAGGAARGYDGTETVTAIKGTTALWIGTPTDVAVYAGGTTPVDVTEETGTYTLGNVVMPWGSFGVPTERATKPAPTTPPANPHITDKVADPIGDNIPQENIISAWFDADADYLYAGAKIQDIPSDPTTTAFISYSVNFKPAYTIDDPSWGNRATGTEVWTGLRAFALYSPARGNLSSDTATTFELQLLSTDTLTQRNFFDTLAVVSGNIDPNTDILWWAIPRALLQDPAGGDILEKTSAVSVPAVGGLVTLGAFYGDSTGDGEPFAFPNTDPISPTVTLVATPSTGAAPLGVTFVGTVTPNNVATWNINYGDGETAAGSGPLPSSFSHVYQTAGSYTATLSVVTPQNAAGSGQATVVATGVPPPSLAIYVDAGGAPVTATCTASCATFSADLDLSGLASGDVTLTARLVRNGETVSTDSVVVALSRLGSIVVDAPLDGAEVTTGDLIVRGRLAGTNTNLAPTAVLSADRSEGTAPLAVQFSLSGDDDHGIASWRLTTGDGRVVDGVALPATVDHTYTNVGTYTATFTVTDTGGRTDSESGLIRVQQANTAPTAPSNPTPADGATGLALPLALAWTASDADGNTLSYDVYLDTTDGSTLVATDQTASYMPAGLSYSTTYFWRVVAKDGMAATTGPVWNFTTGVAPLTEADKSQVVVALIDSGTNPYHQQFRRANYVDHPSTYITGFPSGSNVVQVDLCFFEPITKTVNQSRCPASPNAAAQTSDLSEWQQFSVSAATQTGAGQGTIAWFPGTNVMLVSFNHAGDSRFPGLDGTLGDGDNHGTLTSSNVGGLTSGTCPECIVVMIEGDSVEGIEAAYKWAANQPWIDVITSSVSIGLIGVGANPADFFDATSAATKTAVTSGKLFFEAAGNGVANAGLVPTSTFLGANSNPWTIPVGCSAEHTGQACGYHDFPNAITGSGVDRQSASPNSFTSIQGVGGTSFSSPSSAGVAARALYAARVAMNDTQEGPSTGSGKSLLRLGPGATAPTIGPFANGKLTKLELEEVLFKTARRGALPKVPTYLLPSDEIPNTPLGFIKEGFGNVYAGDHGVGHPTALSTWSSSADMTSVILGAKQLPRRWIEEQWWEQVVTPAQVAIFGADIPDFDSDAFPRDDPANPNSITGYSGPSWTAPDVPAGLSATVPIGAVPTPEAPRLYLHHNNLGPDPASANGNNLYEKYINSIPDPAGGVNPCNTVDCPDQSGVGATGANPLGGFTASYLVSNPFLGGPIVLDRTKDIVIHVEATGYGAQGQRGPPSPTEMTFTLMTGETVVGTVNAQRTLNGLVGVYEGKFKPNVDAISDLTQLDVSWAGPVYSSHIVTRGASWMELPIISTLPPVDYQPITYYVDDFDTDYASNGDSVTLTRDITKLAGDADAGFTFPVPQVEGAVINFQSEDVLVSGSTLLGTGASMRLYPCTFPFSDAGAAEVTLKVTLRAGSTILGAGSLSTTIAGLHDHWNAGVSVPIATNAIILPKGVPLEGSVVISGPAGIFTQNMGVCGGGETRPISLTLQAAALDAIPTTTLGALPDPLTGDVTLSGVATFPVVPGVGEVTWFAKDMAAWDTSGQTMTLDVGGPGTGSDGPLFLPQQNGLVLKFRSAQPVAAHAPALATDGVGTAQFWVTAIGAAADVRVDLQVYLEDAQQNQRLLGSGSVTKHVMPPVGDVQTLSDERFEISFVPAIAVPDADEHLVFVATIRNAGSASSPHATSMGGGADMPIFVTLPTDVDTTPTASAVEIDIGGVLRDVPTTGGAWSTPLDTTTLGNGAHTLKVTPKATYAGVPRTGTPVTREVTVFNGGLNTPPTATLSLVPTSGFAPLLVTANLGGSDAQTAASALAWSIDWGDGSAASTGTGLPATPGHTYGVGNFLATLTVTDAGGMLATASASVSVVEAPPFERILVFVDGANPISATDDSPDGTFAAWSATLSLATPGLREITARHMRGSDVMSEESVNVLVRQIRIPTIVIAAPSDGSVVPGSALTGTTEYTGTVDAVQLSTDADFGSFVTATSSDGFATWSVDVNALGLVEDVETRVHARALAADADGEGTTFADLTLDGAPNVDATALGLPALTGDAVEFQGSADASATGAAIVSFLWDFGDGATATTLSATHSYADDGLYTVSFSATDANGATGTTTMSALVINRAPTVSLVADPATPTDLETVLFTATASDVDGTIASVGITAYADTTRDNVLASSGSSSLSVQFPDDGDYLVVARAADDDGTASEFELILHVQNVRPVANLLASATEVGVGQDVTLDASGSSDPDGTIEEYRFDLGDGTIVFQTEPYLTHRYDAAGIYFARVTVTDDDGASIMSDSVQIKANGAPVLAPIGNKIVNEGATLSFTVTATDGEGDPLTFGIAPLPPGATFNTATGAFAWSPDFGQDGNYPVTFSVTDGRLSDSENVIISVGDVDLPPTLEPIGPKSGAENAALTFRVIATDPDTPSLTFSASPLPDGAAFDPATGVFLWTPSFTQAGTYPVTFGVTDGTTSLSEVVTITIANTDRAPVLAAVAPGSVKQLSQIAIPVSATDADGDLITFSAIGPAGVTVHDNGNGQGVLLWTPGLDSLGPYTITVFAQAGELAASRATVITVLFKTDLSVTLVTPMAVPASPDEVVTLKAVIKNTGPQRDTFRFSASNTQGWAMGALPADITLDAGESREVEMTTTVDGSKPISWVTLTATSRGDGTTAKSARWRVDVPVVIDVTIEKALTGSGVQLARGVVKTTHLDGTPAANAIVTVYQTPTLLGSGFRSSRTGTTNGEGEFAFDFTTDYRGVAPGAHEVYVVAKKDGGFDSFHTTSYTIGA